MRSSNQFFDVERVNGTLIARLKKECVDNAGSEECCSELLELANANQCNFLLDMSDVQHVPSSTALACLVRTGGTSGRAWEEGDLAGTTGADRGRVSRSAGVRPESDGSFRCHLVVGFHWCGPDVRRNHRHLRNGNDAGEDAVESMQPGHKLVQSTLTN